MPAYLRSSLIVVIVVMAFSIASTAIMHADDGSPLPASGDPIWCPMGVTPLGSSGGCSPSFSTFGRLLTWLSTNDPNQPGVIWLERTYNSASESVSGFTLDGETYAYLDNHPLTIQGGWNGPGTSSINHSDPSLFNRDFLQILNWNADVTVNDVLVDGPAGIGVYVRTSGDINLANVDSHNSTGGLGNGYGVVLSNWAAGAGNVVVSDGNFNGNLEEGLAVNSSGSILVHNVTANGNGFSAGGFPGVSLDNRSGSSAPGVTLTGTNVFNNNNTVGLMVFSDGAITVHNVTASGSLHSVGMGAYLDNSRAATPQPVSLTGATHVFNDNAAYGLIVHSDGAIFAENLNARGNNDWGAALGNTGGSGNITLNGSNSFLENGNGGLNTSSNGVITIFGMTTDGNGGDGARMATPGSASVICAKVYRNGEYGINASGVIGSLTLSGVTFTGNVSGPYSYSGTPVINSEGCASLPLQTIKIIHDSWMELNCIQFNGTEVILPDGPRIVFGCPTLGEAGIRFEKLDPLPAPLPDGISLVSALDLSLKEGGIEQEITSGPVTISFVIAEEIKGADLAILYWDGKQWTNLDGAIFDDGRKVIQPPFKTEDGLYEAQVNFTGTFVIVKK